MRKILFIAPRFHTNQYYLIKNLLKKNHIFFISLYEGKIENHKYLKPEIIEQSLISKKIQAILKLRFDTLYFPNFFQVFGILKKIKPDLIILRIYSRPLLYIVSLLSKVFRAKIIYYDQTPSLKLNGFIPFLKYLEIIFAKFIFNAAWFSPILLKPSEKDSLPFVVKTKKNINHVKKSFKLLMIGKFQNRKGHILILKAFKRLIKNYKIKLIMIGEVSNNEHIKNLKYVNNFILKNNLQKNCKLKINMKFQDIEKEYIDCNLFVLPSHSEPAAISILEAQGYGRPVICSDTCGTKTYLDQSCSKIFKSNDINSLIKSIKFFLDRKNIYNKHIIRSYDNAVKKFSAKKFEKSFINFLNINF